VEGSVVGEPMSRLEIIEKIRVMLADVIDDDSLQLDESTTPEDVPDWDSVSHMKLMVNLEGELGVRFEVEEITDIATVKDLIDIIEKRFELRRR
jgi:acyl carrier protein